MPFFLKPEAGSGVSELLDDRLENLKLELKASEKTCQALLPNVEAFTKGSREMCRGAGRAANAFGAALQVDLARTGAAEAAQHPPTAAVHDGGGGCLGSVTSEVTGERSPEKLAASKQEEAATGGGGANGESMRAELLALQLIECANEMEDHLRAQVIEPIERVLASGSDIKAAIHERSLAADKLATAHGEYAKSIARYQSSAGDNANGGPPVDVVQSGDNVVAASDAFAEAHGRAEEALTELLEERGRCLREAASSLKAAQAGFFVRASRCVSSSVAWESTSDVLLRAAGDLKAARSSTEDARIASSATDKMGPAATDMDDEHKGGKGDVLAVAQTRSGIYGVGVEDRSKTKGKWRKGGERDEIRSDASKRLRSSGWFRRLTSSFQTHHPRSASNDSREGMSPPPNKSGEHNDSGVYDGEKRWLSSTAPVTMPPMTSKRTHELAGDGGDNEDAPPSKSISGDLGEVGATSPRSGAGSVDAGEGSARRGAGDESAAVPNADDVDTEARVEAEGETSDYETSSSTTEGFGSDDAGDLWEGRRSTLMGPFGRNSFLPNNDGIKGEIEMAPAEDRDSSGIEAGSEDNSSKGASIPRAKGEQAHDGDPDAKEQLGEMGEGGIFIEQGAKAEDSTTLPELDVDVFVTATTTVEAESGPSSPEGVKHADDGNHAEAVKHAVDGKGDDGDQGELGECDLDSAPRGSAEGSTKVGDTGTPLATPRYPFPVVSPSPAPPSILPASPDSDNEEGGKDEDPLPPVAVEPRTPIRTEPGMPSSFPKLGSSPSISDGSSSKESPRAWRLSWWARASERHPPPVPVGKGDNEEADSGTGTSFAAALDAAAAGGDEVEAVALSAGGAFAPSFNAGDTPAVVDGRGKIGSAGNTDGAVATAGMATGVPMERRGRRRSVRRRRSKPWLCDDKITNIQARPLEAAFEYLDVAGLAMASAVCHAWREPLSGEEGRRRWMRCVRLAEGVPYVWRARFYLHILYDHPSWVREAYASTSTERPRPGVYQQCLAKAEDYEEETRAAQEMQSISEEERDGRTSPLVTASDLVQDTAALLGAAGSSSEVHDVPSPTLKCHKWLEEIETDVLRTCPGDDRAGGDAIHNFDAAISRRSMTGTEERDGGKMGGDASNGNADAASNRVRFSTASLPFGIASGSVEEGSEVMPAQGMFPGEDGDEVNEKRRLSTSGGGTRDKLRRVLRAFAVYNRKVSYCQGMNFVALALLEACGGNDESAFWILAGMCENLELEGLWCRGLERLDLCFFSLDRLLRRHCPSLRQHLSDEGVELSMFTSRWFVTLFTSTDVFGRGTSRKILDMFLVEGWPLLFKMSLGVLLEMRPLLEPADMEGILRVTKFPRAHLFGLRRDGSGRHIAGASFEEATQGSLCESIRAGQMVEHALMLHISQETLEQHRQHYRLQKHAHPGAD